MLLALVATTLATFCLVLLTGLAVLTARGSISVGFLGPYLDRALNEEGVTIAVAFDDTVLAFDRDDGRLNIRIDQVTVSDRQGRRLATVPQVGFRVRVLPLLEGRLEPEQMTLIGPKVRLVRNLDGEIELGLGLNEQELDFDVLESWLAGDWPDPIRSLSRIRVHDASLTVDDRLSGTLWRADRADLTFRKGGGGVVLGLNGRIEQAGRPARIALEAVYAGPGQPTAVTARFSNFEPGWLLQRLRLEALEPLRPLHGLSASVSGNMKLALDPKWWPADVSANLRLRLIGRADRINAGFRYRAGGEPTRLELTLFDFEPALLAETLKFEALQPLRALRLPVAGKLALKLDADWQPGAVDFELAATAGRLDLPELYPAPLAVQGLNATGRIEGRSTLTLERAAVDLGEGKVARFAGAISFAETGVGVRGQGSLSRLAVADLRRLWPPAVQGNARRWIVEHVESGRFSNIRVAVDATPGEFDRPATRADLVVLDFDFADLVSQYWKPMPRLGAAVGHGRIDAKALSIGVESGTLGEIAVSEGRIDIAFAGRGTEVAEIGFLGQGAAKDVLTMLDREPLGLARQVGIDAADAGGTAEVRTHLSIPLLNNLRARDIGYRASARLEGFALDELFGIYAMTDGALALSVARDGIEGGGTLALNGAPVSMQWRYDFDSRVAKPSRFTLDAVLDDAGRQALGINLAPYLTAKSAVRVALSEDRQGLIEAVGRAGLAEARLALPEFEWSKAPGVPAEVEFSFRAGQGDAVEVDRFHVAAKGFEASGRASYAPTKSRIVLDRLRFDQQDLGIDVSFGRDRPTAVTLSGRSLDLQPMLAAEAPPASAEAQPETGTVLIEAELERIVISERFRLDAVRGRGRRANGRWTALQAKGNLNGGPEVLVEMAPQDASHQKLTVTSTDAGAVFAATDILTGTAQGSFRLEALLPEDETAGEPTTGQVTAHDFRLIEAPVLTKILSVASVTGLIDLLQGQGIQFTELSIPFSKKGDVINLKGARAAGPALGITMDGNVDTARDTILIEGAVVPAYTLNSALGAIPLIGNLFVGREGEGVFALSYRVSGPAADPSVSVNPLSALAPGMLRRLVELFSGPMKMEAPDPDHDDFAPLRARP